MHTIKRVFIDNHVIISKFFHDCMNLLHACASVWVCVCVFKSVYISRNARKHFAKITCNTADNSLCPSCNIIMKP